MAVTDAGALACRRALMLQFPNLPPPALWRLPDPFNYALIMDVTSSTGELEQVTAWVDEQCDAELLIRVLPSTSALPPGAERLEARGDLPYPFVLPRGRNLATFLYELQLELPHLQINRVTYVAPLLRVHMSCPLTQDEGARLRDVLQHMGVQNEIEEMVDSESVSSLTALPELALSLAARITDPVLRALTEADEEQWRASRPAALAGSLALPGDAPPERGARCLVLGTTFDTLDLRSYLALYETVFLAPPLPAREERVLARLSVSRDELVELAARGRVQFILPVAIDHYDTRFLRAVNEAAPSAIMGPRSLAAQCLSEFRRRNPLALAEDPDLLRANLALLDEAAQESAEIGVARGAKALAGWLRTVWLSAGGATKSRGRPCYRGGRRRAPGWRRARSTGWNRLRGSTRGGFRVHGRRALGPHSSRFGGDAVSRNERRGEPRWDRCGALLH